ncbi:MAG: hypothetical protein ACTSRS_20500 [Candidatus Helarchaeota archaeon]
MPEIGHLIIGLSIVIPILYFARDRFSYKVAAIFVLNNWIGPDMAQAFGFLPIDFHYLIPYFIWAIPMGLFYSYLSRFSIKRTNRFLTFQDDGVREVSWKNAYLLAISGGMLHTLADAMFRNNLKIKFLEGFFEPTLFQIHDWGKEFGLGMEEFFIIGYIIMIAVSFLTIYILRKRFKDTLIFLLAIVAVTLLNVVVLGDTVFGGEFDTAVIFMALCFIFIPFMLLFYVARDVYDHPIKPPEGKIPKTARNINVVAIISIGVSVIFLSIGLLGVLAPEIIGSLFGFENLIIVALGIVILVTAGLLLFGSIGLFFRINLCRQILMSIYLIFVILVYPIAIILFLCQEDVKDSFLSKSNIMN